MLDYYKQFLGVLSSKLKIPITIGGTDQDNRYNNLSVFYDSDKYVMTQNGNYVKTRDIKKVVFNGSTPTLTNDEQEIALADETKCEKDNLFYMEFLNEDGKVKYPIAYYKNKKLFIYWHFLSSEESPTAQKILEWLITESIERMKKEDISSVNTTQKDILKLISSLQQIKIDKYDDQITNLNKSISEKMGYITHDKKELYTLIKMTHTIKQEKTKLNKDAIRNLEVIKKNKEIRDLKIIKKNIHIFTEPLTLTIKLTEKKNEIFQIGSFEIIINLLDNTISVFNELVNTTALSAVLLNDHPHIRRGTPCWGNLSKTIPDLLSKNDLVGLVHLTLGFLHSYTSGEEYINPYDFTKRLGTKVKKVKTEARRRRRVPVATTDTNEGGVDPLEDLEF